MSTKSHAHNSANNMFNNYGVSSNIVMEGARQKIMGKFKEACQYATVQVQHLEYNTPWENRAKGAVQENKRAAIRAMKKLACPAMIWDYCAELQANIICHTACNFPTLNG